MLLRFTHLTFIECLLSARTVPGAEDTAVIAMSLSSWKLYLVEGKGMGKKKRDKNKYEYIVLRATEKKQKRKIEGRTEEEGR